MKKESGILFLLYIIGACFFFWNMPSKLDADLLTTYVFLLIAYIIAGLIVCVFYSKVELDIFSPDFWVIIPTFFTFSIGPLSSIILGDTTIKGFEVFDGCFLATLIYLYSLVVFMLVYLSKPNRTQIEYTNCTPSTGEYTNDSLKVICLLFVSVGIAMSYFSLFQRGLSMKYILSFGQDDISTGTMEDIGGIINFVFFMNIPFLILDRCMKNKILLVALRIFALIPLIVRGNRFFILMYIVPLVVMFYLNRNRRPKGSTLLIGAVISILALSGVQYVRAAMRLGDAFNEQFRGTFDLSYIWNSIQINLDMYKTLYGACEFFPSGHFYTMGAQMFGDTIQKILPDSLAIVSNPIPSLRPYFIGNNAAEWTYAQLTEYYIEFGFIGCLFFMGIFANFCTNIKGLILKENKTYLDYVLFSQMIPMIFQFVIRGQTNMNLWCLIFVLIPYYIIKWLFGNSIDEL